MGLGERLWMGLLWRLEVHAAIFGLWTVMSCEGWVGVGKDQLRAQRMTEKFGRNGRSVALRCRDAGYLYGDLQCCERCAGE